MKKLVLLMTGIFLFALEINFSSGVLMQSNLKKRFVEYWNNRAHKQFYKTYDLELPYLKYLYSKDWYEDYFSNAPRIKKISIKRVNCKDNICKIGMVLKIYKNSVYYTDKWIKVDNVWYHRFNDNALPQ